MLEQGELRSGQVRLEGLEQVWNEVSFWMCCAPLVGRWFSHRVEDTPAALFLLGGPVGEKNRGLGAILNSKVVPLPAVSEGNRVRGFRVPACADAWQGSVPLAEQGEPKGGGQEFRKLG